MMTLLEVFVLAVALAMDCFTVSLACGLSQRKVVRSPMLMQIILFGVFQGGMTFAGWYGGSLFSSIVKPIDHWIAFALLSYLGGKMIYENLFSKESSSEHVDSKRTLRLRHIATMAIATSIDALAVGVSFAFLSIPVFQILSFSLIIALTSSIFTLAGLGIGIKVGEKVKFPVEVVGGIMLIGIGFKILIEHLSET